MTSEIRPNPRKTTSVRTLGTVDIVALREAVLAIPEALWDAENAGKPNRFQALDATRHILFRFPERLSDWRTGRDRPLMEEWRPLLEPVLTSATANYGYARGDYPRIMLANMSPGGIIHPHRDTNASAKWPHKIHVPLTTNEKVTFFVGGEGYHFAEGEAVEVNNMGLHAVANEGETPRIHLIFEYYDIDQPEPAWLAEVLEQARLRQQTVATR
ncbi:aspartyl/asparaginyl beta-hydroxylase domain-containing protein [Sphingomonas sp. HDW15A]|uniref:aspartyl/asparaginyl beta-hydroxylase domain-containing protein n=1 Tax=Sphingomonas sp. HDW15A TaxID=2714942 RepID=UPI00140DB5B3|nr:aspartyl/asparaginyl beta-hydroxylase domain-containing protein [Sphingomonas sp. HDW15A]QIK95599.1 aspartyl/asparaginyl beta-hydroxylase domain-containing protein [Sphingomonas sp. HDW15A]